MTRFGSQVYVGSFMVLMSCQPSFAERVSEVKGPRVLAVSSEPAEAAPGEETTMRSLVVDAGGPRPDVLGAWAHCIARKPLAEAGTVSTRCLGDDETALVQMGTGQSVTTQLPKDGCRLFGPELPPPVAGEAAGRPVDADPSGGFYQPTRLSIVLSSGEDFTFGATRLVCTRGGLTQKVSSDLVKRGRRNRSPEPTLLVMGTPVTPGEPASFTPGRVRLAVTWPVCPSVDVCGDGICGIDEDKVACPDDCTTPNGCAGAERYLVPTADGQSLAVRRETMQVSWFATAGSLESDRTGLGADDAGNQTENILTLDAGGGWVWVVLRDDRGGVAWVGSELR